MTNPFFSPPGLFRRGASVRLAALSAALLLALASLTGCSALGFIGAGGGGPSFAGGSASAAVSLSADGSLPAAGLTIYAQDVGNADSTLIQTGGQAMLIDAGNNKDGDDVVAFLRSHGVTRLDYVIATHPDADHIGGMDDVIEAFPVTTYIMSVMPEAITPTTKTYWEVLEALDNSDAEVAEAEPGRTYPLGEGTFTILGPAGEFDDANDMSVVCRLDFGNRRFLFTGDAEKAAENALMARDRDALRADYLKVGHHGSRTSTQDSFLSAVSPSVATISCGAGNSYGHPHDVTLKTLKKHGVAVYRTDLQGVITLTSDGNSLNVSTER